MSSNAVKRILKRDIKELKENKLEDLGIFVEFNEKNLLEAKAMIIGPEGSVYEGGLLFFKLFFPNNYPYAPPDVCYISINNIRIHPNLYVKYHKTGHGKVCLSILGTWNGPKWTSVMDISTVLLTIQSILDDKPLLHEPGVTNKDWIDTYSKTIFHENIKTLFIKNSFHIPEEFICFKEHIEKNKIKQKDRIYDIIQKNIDEKCELRDNIYKFYYRIDYKVLKELFNEYFK